MYSTTRFGKRFRMAMLILFYLLASFIPSHVVAAADQEVTIPKAVVDGMVYQTLWREAYQGSDAVEALIFDMFVLQAGNAGMSEAELTRVIGTYMETVDAQLHNPAIRAAQSMGTVNDKVPSAKQSAQSMIEIALTIPELHPYIKTIWKSFAGPIGLGGLDQASQVGSSADAFIMDQVVHDLIQTIVPQIVSASQTNLAIASGCDKVHQQKVNVSVKNFDGRKTVQETPTIKLPPEIIQSIQLNGTINITLNELKELSQIEFNKLNLSLDDMRQTLIQLDAKQDVIVDYIHNQEEQAKKKALAEAKAAEHKLKLEAIEASITIFSTLGGFIDPAFGKQLKTLGESGLKIGKAIDTWLEAVAGKNTLDQIFSASTVVMTGNVLGAVMSIVSLFGNSGPTPEQMILEEIGKLRQQVNQLRTEMHSRFDRIDQELNTIFTTMQDRFDKIDIQLGKINANVLEVQRTLLELDLKLNRMERNNFELLDAVGRRPLLEAINGGLNYQQRTGQPMPFQPDFVDYENLFQTWGTIHAFDALATGPSQRDFSDGALLAELNVLPLDANLNYLNTWLQLHGVSAIASNRLASPRDWLFTSRAYGQLGIEWPEHMVQIDPQRQASLNGVGTDLENAIRSISTVDGANGPQGNHPLFDTVVGYYHDKVTDLHSKLIEIETGYINERFGATPLVDLFGGTAQISSYDSPQFTKFTCNTGTAGLDTPTGLKNDIPGINRYNLAEALGLDHLAICLSAQLLNPKITCNPKLETCTTSGTLQVTLAATVDGVPVMRQRVSGGTVILQESEDAIDLAIKKWSEFKKKFEGFTTNTLTSAEQTQRTQLLIQITDSIHNTLAAYQHELYGRMLNALVTKGALQPLAVETAGSKELLVSMTTLGLAEAVENDELFHAILYGNQQLVDDSQIINTLAISATQSVTDTQITDNARLIMQKRTEERLTVFSEMLNRYLDAIGTAAHIETNDTLADTRRDFNLSMRIARLKVAEEPEATPSPTPVVDPTPVVNPTPIPATTPQASANQVYLPLIER